MKLRDCHSIRKVAADGTISFEVEERWFEVADEVMAEEIKRQVEEHNSAIREKLAQDAAESFDDMISGDPQKIAAIKARRAALLAQLK